MGVQASLWVGPVSGPEGPTILRLIRRRLEIINLAMDDFTVLVDGQEVGVVRNGETVELPVTPGEHRLQLASRRANDSLTPDALRHLHASRPVKFVASGGQVVEFLCGPGAASGFAFSRVKGEEKPNIMLKPKPTEVTWRTWRTYGAS